MSLSSIRWQRCPLRQIDEHSDGLIKFVHELFLPVLREADRDLPFHRCAMNSTKQFGPNQASTNDDLSTRKSVLNTLRQ